MVKFLSKIWTFLATLNRLTLLIWANIIIAGIGAVSGYGAWKTNAASAFFYQPEFSTAISLACGKGLHRVKAERLNVIDDFLTNRRQDLTCDQAFSSENSPNLGTPNVFQMQTLSLQYVFAGLWKLLGFDWSVSAYIASGLVALYALAAFCFSRLLLGDIPSLVIALSIAIWTAPPNGHPENLRDFSKAPFITLLTALAAFVLTCKNRWVLPLAAIGALTCSVGAGFRTDVAMFFVLIPLALCLRCFTKDAWRVAVFGIAVFFIVAVGCDALLLNYSRALGRNSAHFAILGQSIEFMRNLNLGLDHQGAIYQYHDWVAKGLVKLFDQGEASALDLDSANYDAAGRRFLIAYAAAVPANLLIEFFTATYKSMFQWFHHGDIWRCFLAALTFLVLATRFHVLGTAICAIAAAVCGITMIQFDPRHYFHAQFFGMVFFAATLMVIVHDTLEAASSRGYCSPSIVNTFKTVFIPRIGNFNFRYCAGFLGVLVIFLMLLFIARSYQASSVTRLIAEVGVFQRVSLKREDYSGSDTQSFSGSELDKTGYFLVELLTPSICTRFPQIGVTYAATTKYNDLSFSLQNPPGRVSGVYFPIVKLVGNKILRISAHDVQPGCGVVAYSVVPGHTFLPLVWYVGDLGRPPHLQSPVLDGITIGKDENIK